jgi:hypothetical protein
MVRKPRYPASPPYLKEGLFGSVRSWVPDEGCGKGNSFEKRRLHKVVFIHSRERSITNLQKKLARFP